MTAINVKVREAHDEQLDWLVGSLEKCADPGELLPYSDAWTWGGPIIEREKISINRIEDDYGNWTWYAIIWAEKDGWVQGNTPLVAAMRAYVLSRLGEEVEIPSDLP